jgi:hypothetical protein
MSDFRLLDSSAVLDHFDGSADINEIFASDRELRMLLVTTWNGQAEIRHGGALASTPAERVAITMLHCYCRSRCSHVERVFGGKLPEEITSRVEYHNWFGHSMRISDRVDTPSFFAVPVTIAPLAVVLVSVRPLGTSTFAELAVQGVALPSTGVHTSYVNGTPESVGISTVRLCAPWRIGTIDMATESFHAIRKMYVDELREEIRPFWPPWDAAGSMKCLSPYHGTHSWSTDKTSAELQNFIYPGHKSLLDTTRVRLLGPARIAARAALADAHYWRALGWCATCALDSGVPDPNRK